MNQTQITIEIFNDIFNEEQRIDLTNQPLIDVGENHQPNFPENFPDEIDNPIISDGYGKQDLPKEDTKDEAIILGSYTPMNSTGVITFYRNNIKKYSGTLLLSFSFILSILNTFLISSSTDKEHKVFIINSKFDNTKL